jgi:hypothetical protein
MFRTTVNWILMFRVTSDDSARRELRRAEGLLGYELSVSKCERYWKIPELWTCDAAMRFEVSSINEQITHCLLLANRLAAGWYVLGPYLRPDGTLDKFEGIFDHHRSGAKMQSLEWSQFTAAGSAALPLQ